MRQVSEWILAFAVGRRWLNGSNMEEDQQQIRDVLTSFFAEMHDWERYCAELVQDASLSHDEQVEKQRARVAEIFLKHCTKKERKQGLPNVISYGLDGSYNYDPADEVVEDINLDGSSKAVASTRRSKPMEVDCRYSLRKVKGVWLIDSKQRYRAWQEKWQRVEL